MITKKSLTHSLTGFAHTLRQEKLEISPSDITTAVEACASLLPTSLTEFYTLLQLCLIKKVDDYPVFDTVFWQYFQRQDAIQAMLAVNQATTIASLRERKRSKQTNLSLPADSHDTKIKEDRAQEAETKDAKSSSPPSPDPSLQTDSPLDILTHSGQLPVSFQTFLTSNALQAAATLVREPLTTADKMQIATAFTTLSEQHHWLPTQLTEIFQLLTRFTDLAKAVEVTRSTPHPASQGIHFRHSEEHSWQSAASWTYDIAPDVINTPLEHLSTTKLHTLIQAIQNMAQQLKPEFGRQPHTVTRHLTFDYRRTLQKSLATYGEPMTLLSSAQPIRLRRLVTVSDVSGSVKQVTKLITAFLYGLHQAFDGRAQHFIFVSDIDNVTPFFTHNSYESCVEHVMHNAAINYHSYSDYGTMLEQLWDKQHHLLDANTVVLFLGDARSNQFNPRSDLLAQVRHRVRKSYLLNPEPIAEWGTADSSALRYQQEQAVDVIDISTFKKLLTFLQQLPGMIIAV